MKKILLDNDIINYFKSIYFEFAKNYCFDFDEIGNTGEKVHLFFSAEPKLFFFQDTDYKTYQIKKIFAEYSDILKHSCVVNI